MTITPNPLTPLILSAVKAGSAPVLARELAAAAGVPLARPEADAFVAALADLLATGAIRPAEGGGFVEGEGGVA